MGLISRAWMLEADAVLATARSGEQGLSGREARLRLEDDGANELAPARRKPLWRRFLSLLADPMVLVLLGAAFVSALLGEWADSAIIAAVIVLNTCLALFQEGRAEKAVEALAALNAPQATVRRDGKLLRVDARALVLGDIVCLEAGDIVPADLRLLESFDLAADESSLTGESEPAEKSAAMLPASAHDIPLAERANMLFMGAPVTRGHGAGVVVATGMDTQMGRIAGLLATEQQQLTPLQRRLAELSRVLSFAVLAISALVFVLTLTRGAEGLLDAFLLAVSLAVAAVPEGLVVVVTLVLSHGMSMMSRENAIIRRLSAVETLGAVRVICSDKTGTLTENRMQVSASYGNEALLAEAGALCGSVRVGADGEMLGDPTELALCRFAAEKGLRREALLAAKPLLAELPFDSTRKMMSTLHGGSATGNIAGRIGSGIGSAGRGAANSADEALNSGSAAGNIAGRVRSGLGFSGRGAGSNADEALNGGSAAGNIAGRVRSGLGFSGRGAGSNADEALSSGSAAGDSAGRVRSGLGAFRGGGVGTDAGGWPAQTRQYTKGAFEQVLACSTHYLDESGRVKRLDAAQRSAVLARAEEMAGEALRVLGFAYQDARSAPAETQLIFIGLLGLIDLPRREAYDAIRQCEQAGVKTVMVSGDNIVTATAIARRLGILSGRQQAISGAELAAMPERELKLRLDNIRVYARVRPEDKLRIVRAWQEAGSVVAMTGDGVNDAPALQAADIGVGMGKTGAEVSKRVSALVLADDNFATITRAVREGRRVYENIRKAVQFLLASNLAEVLAIFAASLFGLRLFMPIHLLWINLITDCLPAVALGMEKAEEDVMLRPPRPARESLFADGMGFAILRQGTLIAGLTLASFFIGHSSGDASGTTMAFITLSAAELFHAWNMRSRIVSIFSLPTGNRLLTLSMAVSFLLDLALLYLPAAGALFRLQALSATQLLYAACLGFAVVPAVEIEKLFLRQARR